MPSTNLSDALLENAPNADVIFRWHRNRKTAPIHHHHHLLLFIHEKLLLTKRAMLVRFV